MAMARERNCLVTCSSKHPDTFICNFEVISQLQFGYHQFVSNRSKQQVENDDGGKPCSQNVGPLLLQRVAALTVTKDVRNGCMLMCIMLYVH